MTKEEIKSLLWNYRENKTSLEINESIRNGLDAKRENKRKEASITTKISGMPHGNSISNSTQQVALENLKELKKIDDEIKEIKDKIRILKKKVYEVNIRMKALGNRETKIITAHYFERLSYLEISYDINLNEKTVQNISRCAVNKMVRLG